MLVVETADFVDAANLVFHSVGKPSQTAVFGLSDALNGCGGMAGDDPAGRAWAQSYDPAAAAALVAGRDTVNACYNLAELFEFSALNYEAADAASSPGARAAIAAQTARLPGDAAISMTCSPPTATGVGAGAPTGWSIVEDLIGRVWPNGHQDRLRACAAAWRRAADAVTDAADMVWLASVRFILDQLPEADDIGTVCLAMRARMQRLGAVYNSLAEGCEEYARHLDVARSSVLDALGDLAWQTGLIEGVGFLASIVTAGAAQAPTQAIEAGRLAAIAARVRQLIEAFAVAVRLVQAKVAAVLDTARALSAELQAVLRMRAAAASVTAARRLPIVGRIGEQVAALRIATGFRGRILVGIENPKRFDPQLLEGMTMSRVRASIPKNWKREPTKSGGGEIFIDPERSNRRIRIMPGYGKGTRPEEVTWGPYVTVSQNSDKIKLPLAGNPTLR
ncbi:hypothetical protein [uncultured Jatrophihabitans sp.]|uniref:WXG100-like domain-containing protein n=1 Tax=uncultured Jatrophihabitans sp. TaxID=1610747 RepID=UPI0035C9BAD4